MRLASEKEILIMLCSQAFSLRATLRAAYCLNLKYRGFGNLANAIETGTFTAYQDVIKAGCNDPAALNQFLKPFHSPGDVTPLGETILANRPELLEFVLILAGVKTDSDEPAQAGEPISFEEYHARLYRLGTGWLGWSAADTWEATPSEIIAAYQGRLDMLKAVFGGKGDDDQAIDGSKLDRDARAELSALGDLSVVSMPRAR